MKYEVWREGYAGPGGGTLAAYLATIEAATFRDACDMVLAASDNYDSERLTIFGARLFDNETTARREFG